MGVACAFCGQEWERHPAELVECPDCGAPAKSRCRRPSGHEAMAPHTDREQLALDRGLLSMCPEGPSVKAGGDQTTLFE